MNTTGREPQARRSFKDIMMNVRKTPPSAAVGGGNGKGLTGEIQLAPIIRQQDSAPTHELEGRPTQPEEAHVISTQERRVTPLLMRDAQTGNPVDISFGQSFIAGEAERLRERHRISPMGNIEEVPIDITFAHQPSEGLTFVVHESEGNNRRDRYFRVTKPNRSAGNLPGVFVVPLTPTEVEQFRSSNGTVVELAEIQELHASTRGVLGLVAQGKLTREHLLTIHRDRHMAAPGGRQFPEGRDLPEPRMSRSDQALFNRQSTRDSGR